MSEKKIKIGEVKVECDCGETHSFKVTDFSISRDTGCDSCGFGGYTRLCFSCPTTKKWKEVDLESY